jgi:dihydrofolate synthase/folylpolyglutamate synthase
MFSRLPMFQRQGSTAFKKDLTNIKALCKILHEPQNSYPTVHVAGTNGKGSTSHMIASVLQAAGYKVGLYTSPHLKDFRERIRVNGQPIDETTVIDFIETHQSFLVHQQLSFFELTVGMAFEYFSTQQVDIAVIEVGLGGRLDSTNIIRPLVSVITNIGLDHTQYLGETLKEIAFEKGGIIKREIPVVVGEFQEEVIEVFQSLAKAVNAPVFIAEHFINETFETDLLGVYQKKNMKTAVQCLRLLDQMGFEIGDDQVKEGLKNVSRYTGLKGRWQVLGENPKVICDTAHNREGLSIVMSQVQKESFNRLHMVLGVVNDKDLKTILTLLPKNARYYFCKPDIPRGLSAEILKREGLAYGLYGDVFESVGAAYKDAMQKAASDDLIFIGGSTFVVAELDL